MTFTGFRKRHKEVTCGSSTHGAVQLEQHLKPRPEQMKPVPVLHLVAGEAGMSIRCAAAEYKL